MYAYVITMWLITFKLSIMDSWNGKLNSLQALGHNFVLSMSGYKAPPLCARLPCLGV